MKRLCDMLKQIPPMAGFLAIIGLASYLLVMILRSVAGAIGIDMISTEERIVWGMIISAAVSFVICFFGIMKYFRRLGAFDAAFVKENLPEKEPKPSFWYAFIACCSFLAAYGAVLLLLNFYHWNFFEGPVFYLSFAFYAIPETLYPDTTSAFVFVWCEAVSFAICGILYLPAMIKGYYAGFKSSEIKTDN